MNDAEFCRESAARCEKLNQWPEWKEEDSFRLIERDTLRHWYGVLQNPDEGTAESFAGYITNHEAACIFERFWREKLYRSMAYTRPIFAHKSRWIRGFEAYIILEHRGDPDLRFLSNCIGEFENERIALFAAVDAVLRLRVFPTCP